MLSFGPSGPEYSPNFLNYVYSTISSFCEERENFEGTGDLINLVLCCGVCDIFLPPLLVYARAGVPIVA